MRLRQKNLEAQKAELKDESKVAKMKDTFKDLLTQNMNREAKAKEAADQLQEAIPLVEAMKQGEGLNAEFDRSMATSTLAALRIAAAHADGSLPGLSPSQQKVNCLVKLQEAIVVATGNPTGLNLAAARKQLLETTACTDKERRTKYNQRKEEVEKEEEALVMQKGGEHAEKFKAKESKEKQERAKEAKAADEANTTELEKQKEEGNNAAKAEETKRAAWIEEQERELRQLREEAEKKTKQFKAEMAEQTKGDAETANRGEAAAMIEARHAEVLANAQIPQLPQPQVELGDSCDELTEDRQTVSEMRQKAIEDYAEAKSRNEGETTVQKKLGAMRESNVKMAQIDMRARHC